MHKKIPNNSLYSILVQNYTDGKFIHQLYGSSKYQAKLDVTEFLFELEYKTENPLIIISQRYIENVYLYKCMFNVVNLLLLYYYIRTTRSN